MFWQKQPVILGAQPVIALDDTRMTFWPLEVGEGGLESEQLINNAIDIIKHKISLWMQTDVFYVTRSSLKFTDTLSHQLYQLPLPFLPTEQVLSRLAYLIGGNDFTSTGMRLMDAFAQATSAISPTVFSCIRGRFLFAMTEGLQKKAPNGDVYPSKEEWVDTLIEIPWAPYLQYLQELYDTDENFIKFRDQSIRDQLAQTTVVSNRSQT